MASIGQDVEIKVKATDAVGPGVDAARARFRELETTLNKTSGGLSSMASAGIKLGVAIGVVRGGLSLASAAINAFNGDSEAVLASLSKLPFGIGAIVGSLKDLSDAFGSNGERIKAAWDTLEGYKNSLSDLKNKGIAAGGGIAGINATYESETDAIVRNYAKGPNTSGMSQTQREEAFRLQEESRKEEMTQAAQRRDKAILEETQRSVAAEIKRGEEVEKRRQDVRDSLLKQAAESDAKAVEDFWGSFESEMRANAEQAAEDLAGSQDFFGQINKQNASAARREFDDQQSQLQGELDFFGIRKSGNSQLGSGSTGRFSTGLARSGEERLQREEALLQKQVELQERMLKALEARPPSFDVTVGVFN